MEIIGLEARTDGMIQLGEAALAAQQLKAVATVSVKGDASNAAAAGKALAEAISAFGQRDRRYGGRVVAPERATA